MKNFIRWMVPVLCLFSFSPAAEAIAVDEMGYGFDYSDRAEKNAKFVEYRYKRDEKLGFYFEFRKELDIAAAEAGKTVRGLNWLGILGDGADYFNVDFSGRTPEEVDLEIATGSYGEYKLTFGIHRIGHNFYYDARTLYSGNGSGSLQLSDAIQTDLQNSSAATRDDKMNVYLNTVANRMDMSIRRDKLSLNLEKQSSKRPVKYNFSADQEIRKGSRPYGISLGGHSNAVEVPEPVDYGTSNLGAGAEYHANGLFASFGVQHSHFRNENSSIKVENPLFVTDSTAGSAVGRNSLFPDNTYDNLAMHISKAMKDKHHSRANLKAVFTRMRQDENLLPMTNNSAYDTAVPSFVNLGTTKAGLKIDKRQYEAELSSSLTDKFHIKTSFHYDQHKNRSPFYTTRKYQAYDVSIASGGETTTYVSYIKRIAEAEAEYEITPNLDASFMYEHEVSSFKNGSARHEIENAFEFSLVHRRETVISRIVVLHAVKNSDYPDYQRWNVEVPTMRKFYAASRDRDQITAMVTMMPTDNLTLNLQAVHGNDKYPQSLYGLKSSQRNLAGLNADYQHDEKISVSAFYTFEYDKSFQRSHSWASRSPTDPWTDTYNQNNSWTLDRRDKWRTLGATVSAILVENVLDLDLSGSLSRVDGMADYDSPTASTPPNDFVRVDESRITTIEAKLNYRPKTKPTRFALGYRFDRFRIYDFQYDGLTEVTEGSTGSYLGLLNMNTLDKSYGGVHTVYLNMTYPF